MSQGPSPRLATHLRSPMERIQMDMEGCPLSCLGQAPPAAPTAASRLSVHTHAVASVFTLGWGTPQGPGEPTRSPTHRPSSTLVSPPWPSSCGGHSICPSQQPSWGRVGVEVHVGGGVKVGAPWLSSWGSAELSDVACLPRPCWGHRAAGEAHPGQILLPLLCPHPGATPGDAVRPSSACEC